MQRSAIHTLKTWKDKPLRKPLLVQGARQVGKTWLMKHFGAAHYKNVAYISFNDSEEAKLPFAASYNVESIISTLELLTDTKITPHDTLIILDEIQECDRALNALKFFKENAPQYSIMAAGSLLGVALKHKNISFPVGQVDFLELGPLSFHEFLLAMGEEKLAALLSATPLDTALLAVAHNKLIELLKHYLYVGGMPEVVAQYAQSKSLLEISEIQKNILRGYQHDFAKYVNAQQIPRINSVWNSLPSQLAKENKKFAYAKITKGARAREYEEGIEWLALCGLIHRVHRFSKPSLPLADYGESSAFKLYMLDCGLLCAQAALSAQSVIEGNAIFTEFKGALTEQYVLQELKSTASLPLAYWTNEAGSAKVNFVFQHQEHIIPLEVKASINLKARSLASYRSKYEQKVAVRTSLANYKKREGLYDIPLYAISRMTALLSM